jgi:hypothetical protein
MPGTLERSGMDRAESEIDPSPFRAAIERNFTDPALGRTAIPSLAQIARKCGKL